MSTELTILKLAVEHANVLVAADYEDVCIAAIIDVFLDELRRTSEKLKELKIGSG